MGKRKVPDLYRAPFPLYSIKVDPKTGLVILAGGGGASKTGIKNAVHFLEVQLLGENQHSASLLHSHDTDTRATMNLALGDGVIAAGQDGLCALMKFDSAQKGVSSLAANEVNNMPQGSARQRAGRKSKGAQDDASACEDKSHTKDETAHISVTGITELQSDENPQDPLQKVVRFSPDLSLLLTGGTDGHIRVWEFPSLKKKLDFQAHKGEIEDLDVSQENKHLVTVGRDFACSVWSNNQLVTALKWHETMPQMAEKTYRYMACRFGKVEDQKDALRLYTVQIPHKRERKPPPCYLTKWDGKSFLPMLTAPCGAEVISSLAISPQDLQSVLAAAVRAYSRMGLTVNTSKTEVVCQWSSNKPSTSPVFTVSGEQIPIVPSFRYLGSILSDDNTVDSEVQNRIKQAAAAFGRLRRRVFQNKNLHLHTKVSVHQAIFLTTLLYSCEAWVTYSRHIKALEQFHIAHPGDHMA
ncbi:prolactin regulatory element-binding protein-like isoform X1 [Entelurus aequoreus]|uniref:prolactin regulatory element-binding protein-like isoform X1 n=1 Tax=Entelurus aequoreus TaxID=161455 RepID=UPI002B1D3890|nr:prolactin regulatory element-binding protein-like isoform X1 [Entelurus aequoreus]